MDKLKLLQKELKGLDVEWKSHGDLGQDLGQEGVINMATVNGHSIIWHKYAYTRPNEPTVEVYFVGDNQPERHVPIKGLGERIKNRKLYQVACSGWLTVQVGASNAEEAAELVRDTTPGISGELYDMEIDDIKEVKDV